MDASGASSQVMLYSSVREYEDLGYVYATTVLTEVLQETPLEEKAVKIDWRSFCL